MIVTQAINVHLDKQSQPTIETVQSDTGRAVTAALFNQGKAWEPPAGATGTVRHSILHDGEFYTSAYDTLSDGTLAVEFSGNVLTVHLSPEILSIPGVGELQVGILHGDVLVATMSVLLRVQRNIGTQGLTPTAYTDLSHHIQNELVRQFRNVYDQGSWLENLHHRVDTDFTLGGIDQDGEFDPNRNYSICSDFIYHGGREVSVSFPAGVKVRCLFYDKDFICRGETAFFEHSFTHYSAQPYLRLEASYEDDGRIQDPIALAAQIGVFYQEGFQGCISALEYRSFRMCTKAGYYRFTKEDLAELSDAPDINTGGVLEVLPHGDTNVVFQTLRTSDGQLWFRKGNDPFRQVTSPGVFTVTVNPDGNADKGCQEIQQAYGQNRFCLCNLEGLLLPLVMLDDAVAYFSGVFDGREYHVEIGEADDVTVENKEIGGGEVFTVTYTDNEDEHQRIDKTFDEIRAAIDSGMDVRCEHRDGVNVARYSLSIYTNYLITFTAQQGNYACTISIRNNGSAEYSDVDLSAGDGGSGGLTSEQINALDGMFRVAAYTADAQAQYAAFRAAFGLDGGEDDGNGDSGGDDTHVHQYYSTVTNATCENDGQRVHICECGDTYTTVLPALGHDFVNGICSRCGTVDPDYEEGGKEPETTEPVYQLAEATTFNADKVIDTGYKLLDVEKSWSVCVDCTDTARGGVVWDASPNASQGLAITHRGGYFRCVYLAGSLYKDIGSAVGNYKMIVTHAKNTDRIEYHFVDPSASEMQSGEIAYTKYLTDANIIGPNPLTVKIGGNFDGSTASYRGTVNRFEIYERVLTAEEISAFMEVE